MPFFTFDQNNSGGVFDFDNGVTHHVIIEAKNAEDANRRAEDLGLYFDGVREGMDCGCCGDRWYAQWRNEKGTPDPMYCDFPLDEHLEENLATLDWGPMHWRKAGQPEIYLYRTGAKDPEGFWYAKD